MNVNVPLQIRLGLHKSVTCHAPMPAVGVANGRWNMRHILKASLRISVILLINAQKAADGKTDENRKT